MISNGRAAFARPGLVSRVATALFVFGISATLGVSAMAAEDPDITVAPRELIDDAASRIVSILGRKDQSSNARVYRIGAEARSPSRARSIPEATAFAAGPLPTLYPA